MTYELWDTETRNVVGAFPREADALMAVRRALDEHGRVYAEAHALIREDGHGRSREIAHGGALVERALATRPAGERASA